MERIRGVVFETKSGPIVAKAKVIIDCTGDGDVAAFAGASFEVGRSRDRMVQPMTLMFLIEGFVLQRFREYVLAHPDQWHGVNGLTALMQEATCKRRIEYSTRKHFAVWKRSRRPCARQQYTCIEYLGD